jgi:TolB-like protein/Tfp pilus assembly protein PilF
MIHKFGDCELDVEQQELRRAGATVAIEPQVFELLTYLVAHPGRVVTKDELNGAIWSGRAVSDSALSSCIKSARQAIGDDGKTQSLIRTVHGRGFRFVGSLAQDREGAAPHAPAAREKPVVAVVPFDNLSGDSKEDYFSDGVTADVIATLAKHRWLAVLARNATARFKGTTAAVAEIARETGAHYIVEGSVRRVDQRVRVSVQLIDAASGNCIWSERYDRQSEDIFDIQDDITQTVSARIEPEIGYEERRKIKSAVGSRDLRAWEWFHLGMSHFFKFTGADNLKAQEYLQKARERDPSFGDAHAWWAYAVVLGTVYWDTEPTGEQFDEALQAVGRALDGDPRNAVFFALKARVQLARGEYESAIEGNRIAIELNPSFAAAHCGLADSLTYLGRCEEAVEHFERAIALSTNDPQCWAFYTYGALALIFCGKFERAVEWADHAAAIPHRQYWTLAHKAVALALLGRSKEARDAFAAALAEQPALSIRFARKKLYYLKRSEQLDRYLKGLALAGAAP